jgi:hypothetical protein
MLTIICAGYMDADEVKHPCGKVMGTKPSENTGETHTYCDDCFRLQNEALDTLISRRAKGVA